MQNILTISEQYVLLQSYCTISEYERVSPDVSLDQLKDNERKYLLYSK